MVDASKTVVAATIETVAQGFVPTIKLSTLVPVAAVLVHHSKKLEKFNGKNFKR